VVVDLQMPSMDGIELLRVMAEKRCTAKIIVCSGIDTRTLETARRLGTELGLPMAGVLAKPVRLSEFNDVLNGLSIGDFEADPTSLRQAIMNDDLYLLYQPKVSLDTGKVVAVEALLRWKTPSGQVVSPDIFIPMAEEQGVMDEVTDWVLRNSVGQLGRWKAEGLETSVAVNVSAANLHNLKLPDNIAELCVEAGVAPERVMIELTETASMSDPTKMMDVLARFRIKRFSLSIDDFGTGYSSLSALQQFPIGTLKIDQSFVRDAAVNSDDATIVRTIIDMGKALEVEVVAEGVENEEQFNFLRSRGCHYGQGRLFGDAMSADSFFALLLAQATGRGKVSKLFA
jgi:sensor c-di-GMP phosphodiesterase-like protein